MKVLAASTPVVDWSKLGQVIGYSFAAGVGVTLCFSLAILGAIRFAEARRGSGAGTAVVYAVLTVAGLVVTIGAVVVGIIVMASKT